MLRRAALLATMLVAAAVLIPFTAAADNPAQVTRCSDRLVDTAGSLNKDQHQNLVTSIDDAVARTGMDIYVRILPSAPYEYSNVAEANMFNVSSDQWWSTTLDNCPNWTQGRDGKRTESPNLFALFIGANDDYVSIGHGVRLSAHEVNEVIYTTIKPALKEHGVEASINAAISADIIERSSPSDTWKQYWWIVIVPLALLVLPLWTAKADRQAFSYATHTNTVRTESTDSTHADRAAKLPREKIVAGVRAALAQLDSEWLAYELDTEAYYLIKPVLRDHEDAVIREYHDAMYTLREACDDLDASDTPQRVKHASELADKTLRAWDATNRHALKAGVSTLSPVERAALRRIHAMVSQLTDSATPRAMVSTLLNRMKDEIGKLERTPVPWTSVENLPAIQGSAGMLELVQGAR